AKKAARPKTPPGSALQGEWGEREAEKWLVENEGLIPVARRAKVGRDELDLVMKAPPCRGRAGEIVFVEVKTRRSELFGGGMAAVDARKRHALCRAASRWMMRNADCPMRIDVVEVYGDHATGRIDRVLHQKAAVPLERRINALALGSGRHPAR
ncbi:MAG: YraN family protein, partial [Kiritimatiellae bacterium]|nr:YraN family protein [Kiritimatiellia bacterium]